jgi:hypothetical protein
MNTEEIQRWLQERLPSELCAAPPDVTSYDDELLITLTAAPHLALTEDAEAEQAAIARLREESRPLRMQLAREVQGTVGRPVAWSVRLGASEATFTTRTTPVMTRLNRAEREVLDTLVAAGLAETRSAALAYVVRAFAAEHGVWLAEARQALAEVAKVRGRLKLTPKRGRPPETD